MEPSVAVSAASRSTRTLAPSTSSPASVARSPPRRPLRRARAERAATARRRRRRGRSSRASLASCAQIVQYPFCCGDGMLGREARRASTASARVPRRARPTPLLRVCRRRVDHARRVAPPRRPPRLRPVDVGAPRGRRAVARAGGRCRPPPRTAEGGSGDRRRRRRRRGARRRAAGGGARMPSAPWVAALLGSGVAARRFARSSRSVLRTRRRAPTSPAARSSGSCSPTTLPVDSCLRAGERPPAHARVALPLAPAPPCSAHTREVLGEIGTRSRSSRAATRWSDEYLPGTAAAAASPVPEAEKCPVCLEALVKPLELACGHAICGGCATAAAAAGHRRCPTCRAPHLLSPETLAARASGWRRRYASWRAGGVRGSHGELASIAAPPAAGGARPRRPPAVGRRARGGGWFHACCGRQGEVNV